MIRPPVSQRIESALLLQPMTVEQLARCLTLAPQTIRVSVRQMRTARRVRAIHVKPLTTIKPWVFYSLASGVRDGFCQAPKAASPATRASRGGV